MGKEDNTKEILQWVRLAAAFGLLLIAAFWLFQTLKGERTMEFWTGSFEMYQGWAQKLAKTWRGWVYMGSREPAGLAAGILLCGLWELLAEYGDILLLLL